MELKDLGLTQEQVFEAVVNKIASDLLNTTVPYIDEDGIEQTGQEKIPFAKELTQHIKDRIDRVIGSLTDKYIMPNAEHFVETLVLQETNKWGEKTGKPVTFIEYLTQQAEQYMREEVNFEGKNKKENSWSIWKSSGTRIEYAIHKYLQYHIETWAKNALTEANKTIVSGLQKAVEIKLQEVLKQLQVTVKTG